MGPGDLARALDGLELEHHPALLVGLESADDAGVYRLTDELALVQTVDFFTPIVDDPFAFGQIAAANALSDVYAMGANPICAMNIVGFPAKTMDISVLNRILRGGLTKLREAGVALVGGHSVSDPELKYGLSVTGVVHPDRVVTNRGALPGDKLVLTKPLGTGVVATAAKGGKASAEAIDSVVASMSALNRDAAQVALDHSVRAGTDVTGFGLAGHAREMIADSGIGLEIVASSLPFFPAAIQYAGMGLLPGGLQRNRQHFGQWVSINSGVPQNIIDLIYDPQTSGGLLVALPGDRVESAISEMRRLEIAAAVIGEVVEDSEERITLG